MPSPEPGPLSAAPPQALKNATSLSSFEAVPTHDDVTPNTAGGPELPLYSGQSQKRRKYGTYAACDPCRVRKALCDGMQPVCGHCTTNSLPCAYFGPASTSMKNQDVLDYGRKFDQIQGKLEAVLGLHINLESKQKTIQSDLSKVVESLQRLTTDQEHHRESLRWLTTNHQQTLSSSRLLNHFEARGEVLLTAEERFKLEDVDEKLMKLSHSSHWSTIRSRLVR
jgi:Fungal Zn(2)-Cys(6) binuclear cluster domain